MKCPQCHSYRHKVVDSRKPQDEAYIRRMRECLDCHSRFKTYERIAKENDGLS